MAEEGQRTGSATPQLTPAYRGEHQVKPLPFDAAKLKGLSEKLITSHHQNNYGGAVRRLNQIQQQIGSLPKDAAPYQSRGSGRTWFAMREPVVKASLEMKPIACGP
jgi:hypothetical protein